MNLCIPHDDPQYMDAAAVIARLRADGHDAVLAGGCVRDMLLGAAPKDYDIATSAPPERVQELFASTRSIGRPFGVILVVWNGRGYEVASFRSEAGYSDGRRPDSVRAAGIEQDAQRRDFTINGMYFDPSKREVIDHVGGRADLDRRWLRAIGDPYERFREDHLRLLRAVRFAARLDLTIEAGTYNALRRLAHLVDRVARERVGEELRILLTDRAPAGALRLMDELGLLAVVLPELEACRGCEQPENYHPEGDVLAHTLLTVEQLGPFPEFTVAMAALLHDIGKPQASIQTPLRFPEHERIGARLARQVCARLRRTNRETERIAWLVKRHMYFKDAPKMKTSTLKKLFAEEGFEQLCQVALADALASWGRTEQVDYVLAKRDEMSDNDVRPQPLISGRDLLDMGWRPGPAMGRVLRHVFDAQLEGELSTRQDALAEARRYARCDAGDGRGAQAPEPDASP